jgi:CRP-like cAMP-binding protein
MIAQEKIQYYLSTFKELQLTDLLMLFALAQKKKLEAGEVYIKEGEMHNKLAYITKGLIRTYAIKENGEEATLQLHWEDQFFASRDNVILQKPSRFIFQAMEPTELLEVDYYEMQQLLDANPQFAAARNYFMLQMIEDAMERVESFILLSPEERYNQLLQEKPDIINRVPSKYIATLLGITPVSLSRLRKRMATKSRH